MKNTLWLLDIGNTKISVAKKSGGKFSEIGSFDLSHYPKVTKLIVKSGGNKSNTVVICSVVPKICNLLFKRLKHFKGFNVKRIGVEINPEINSKYIDSNKLGKDRLVNVFGALRVMKSPFILFDFGTATTIDFISAKGVFEGGMILPGMAMALQAMHEKTALLPKIKLRKIKTLIGKDTQTGMIAGVLQGYGAMVNGLIDAFQAKYGIAKIATIGTGGLVDIISGYCRKFTYKDRLLTLKAIAWAYEDHNIRYRP